MRYPIAIEPGTGTTAFGVVVPDRCGEEATGTSLEDWVGLPILVQVRACSPGDWSVTVECP